MAENKMETEKADPSSEYYFNSYAHFGIHEEMIKDEVRTKSYRNSIYNNKHLFEGKVVMDVGCGTGILCLFAAKAGAKKVYGMECSDIAEKAKEIVKANGYADVIEIVKGKVEEIDLPGVKVDIIISEWMGYFLLYESMLDTVLHARDKWLAPGGSIYPDTATLYLTGIEDADYKSDRLDFWDDVYGYKMSCVKEIAYCEPLVEVVEPQAIITNTCHLIKFDLNTVKKEDLTFSVPFTLTATKQERLHALVAYFDIIFSKCHKPIYFSTGPKARYTHWKQTIFYLKPAVALGKGEKITGNISTAPNQKNPRDLNIVIDYSAHGRFANVKGTQNFFLR